MVYYNLTQLGSISPPTNPLNNQAIVRLGKDLQELSS